MRESKVTAGEKPFRGELFTMNEAAKYLRMGKSTFYECVKKGYIVTFNPPIGPQTVDSADLDDYLFFSRFSDNKIIINQIEKEKILARFNEQVLHALAYIEKFIDAKIKTQGGNMKRS